MKNLEVLLNHGVNVDTNEIYLFGNESYSDIEEQGVEYKMANQFIKNFRLLEELNPDKRILIHMKTCGGFWIEGMAIYDTIKNSKNKVTIISYTHARSMSSIILQAADRRVLMPHSYFLYHEGTVGPAGNYTRVLSEIEYEKVTMKQMLDIYADSIIKTKGLKKSNKKSIIKKLESNMKNKHDVFLFPDEAIEEGFADEIFDKNKVY